MYIMGYAGIHCVNKESGAAINGKFTCDSSIMSAYLDAEQSQTVQKTKGVFGLGGKESGGWRWRVWGLRRSLIVARKQNTKGLHGGEA